MPGTAPAPWDKRWNQIMGVGETVGENAAADHEHGDWLPTTDNPFIRNGRQV
jgi:hypothetical protein